MIHCLNENGPYTLYPGSYAIKLMKESQKEASLLKNCAARVLMLVQSVISAVVLPFFALAALVFSHTVDHGKVEKFVKATPFHALAALGGVLLFFASSDYWAKELK